MKAQVGKFNSTGQSRWLELLDLSLRTDPDEVLRQADILANDENYIDYFPNSSMEVLSFSRRHDLAKHLDEIVTGNGLLESVGNPLFWNWMAAKWMGTLVNADPRTNLGKKLGLEVERWALTSGALRYHRHLVSSPYFAYVDNGRNAGKAMCLLATPVLEPGELVERIAGKKSFASGPICELATDLYTDPKTGSVKNGITVPPGHPKAFARFFSQIDRNIDYQQMDVPSLKALLPSNFDKWK